MHSELVTMPFFSLFQLIWSLLSAAGLTRYPWDPATSLFQPLFFGPSVAGLVGVHCTYMLQMRCTCRCTNALCLFFELFKIIMILWHAWTIKEERPCMHAIIETDNIMQKVITCYTCNKKLLCCDDLHTQHATIVVALLLYFWCAHQKILC